jgi:hypothetical protein
MKRYRKRTRPPGIVALIVGAVALAAVAVAATTSLAATGPAVGQKATGPCAVIYEVESQWPASGAQAFQGDIQVVNLTATTLTKWSFAWTFANDQKIYQSWGADFAQAGQKVTANSEPNEGFINANGGRFHMGFLANVGKANAVPTSFTFNGTTCPMVNDDLQVIAPAAGGGQAAPPPAKPANPTTAPPVTGKTGTCKAIYEIETEWPTSTGHAFLGDIQIVNTTATTLTAWSFTWSFPKDQKIYQSWGADFAQAGANITANSEPHEGYLAGNGGRFHIGFLATVGNANIVPGNFALNGNPCPLAED